MLLGMLTGRGAATRSVSYQDVWGKDLDWAALTNSSVARHLSISTTLACVDLKAASIMSMPLQEFTDAAGVPVKARKSLILDDPSETFSPEEWVYVCAASMELWDEAIGLVTARERNGWPRHVEWMVPDSVQKVRDGRRVRYHVGAQEFTEWRHGGEIIHLRRRPLPGELNGGMSTSRALAPLVTIGTEGAKALATHYVNGGNPLAVLSWDGDLKDSDAEKISERYEARRRRFPGRPLVVGRGYAFNTVARGDVAKDMAEMRQQIATEIAVARGVPPEWVGGTSGNSMTYSNLEGLTQSLEVRTLMPVYTAMERSFSRNLLPRPRYCRFNSDAVVRADLLTRMRAHDIQIRNGMESRDEARSKEERPPIPDGTGDLFLWPPYRTTPTPAEEAM